MTSQRGRTKRCKHVQQGRLPAGGVNCTSIDGANKEVSETQS